MPVIEVSSDADFQPKLAQAGAKLVVVDFYAAWCGPCRRMAPVLESFSNKYPNGVFLKVNVDECTEVAASNGIRSMPTFILYRNKVKVDSLQGADPNALEEKIKKWIGTETSEGEGDSSSIPKGHMDLTQFIEKSNSECLNEADNHPLVDCLNSGSSYLESDCDEQLIISLAFSQAVKLHSLRLKAPKEQAPKTIKLFINQPKTVDFDMAEAMESLQTLDLDESSFEDGSLIPLKFVKLQNVQQLTLFVKDNLSGSETTRIDQIMFIGSLLSQTNMSDFKRVAGKKGEAH